MIFGKNAEQMLKYQKAKAKMVEYNVARVSSISIEFE